MEYVTRKSKKKVVTFRIDEELLQNFRLLCSAYGIKQVAIVEEAMKKVVEDLTNRMDNETDDK